MTTTARREYVAPRVNIIDRPETVLLEAELPGVSKDGVALEIKDDELVLIGRRKAPENGNAFHISERPKRDYRRVFAVTKAIDLENIEAEMKDGVLRITLHKADCVKPRRIEIK